MFSPVTLDAQETLSSVAMAIPSSTAPLYESERIQCFPFTLADFPHLKALHQHPAVYPTTFTGFSSDERVLEELQEYITEFETHGISQLKMMTKPVGDSLETASASQFVGRVGLQYKQYHPERDKAYEVRVSLMPEFWGGGIATEVVGKTVAYAFETMQLPRLVVGFYETNKKSHTIVEKLGFHPLESVTYGEQNVLYYDMTLAQWQARHV
ncbi:MAG: GNAT family N-acetyltransferase [Vampirovibrionales bacterium]